MKTAYLTDLDGTLLRPDGTLSPFTAQTISNLCRSGMVFSVATARSVNDAAEILHGLTVSAPITTMNGTFFIEGRTGRILHYHVIPREVLSFLLDTLCQSGCYPNVYSLEDGELAVEYSKKNTTEAQIRYVKRCAGQYRSFEAVKTYRTDRETCFVSCVASEDKVKKAAALLAACPALSATVYRDTYYPDSWYIEVSGREVGKANAVAWLREWSGCDRVVVFGDNHNDLPMFRAADEAIAVDNACDEVKAAATRVIASNEEDGVAKYLAKVFKMP